jgi:hypothetical protein
MSVEELRGTQKYTEDRTRKKSYNCSGKYFDPLGEELAEILGCD